MFTFAFVTNIVVLGIGGLMLLVGILLLGFGIFALLRARRAPAEAVPSYSTPVDYPAEAGMDENFEDAPRWADEIAADAGEGGAGAGAEGSRKRIAHGREKAYIGVGALLALLGVYLLLNAITLLT